MASKSLTTPPAPTDVRRHPLKTWLKHAIPNPVRERLSPGRLLLLNLALLTGLTVLGLAEAFIQITPQATTTATALSAVQRNVIDPYRSSDGNGHVWLTDIAMVRIAHLPGSGQPAERVLLDAPTALQPGRTLTVHVSQDGTQVRAVPLPGPPVLPKGQGALLLFCLATLYPLLRRWRRGLNRRELAVETNE